MEVMGSITTEVKILPILFFQDVLTILLDAVHLLFLLPTV